MGFIFRTIFWLGLAITILPPDARLGGDEEVAFKDIDIGLELHNVAYAVWAFGSQAVTACDTNPELCKAATGLADATWATATTISAGAAKTLENPPAETLKTAQASPHRSKKVQARVE